MLDKLIDLIRSIISFNAKLLIVLVSSIGAFGPWAVVGYLLWLWLK